MSHTENGLSNQTKMEMDHEHTHTEISPRWTYLPLDYMESITKFLSVHELPLVLQKYVTFSILLVRRWITHLKCSLRNCLIDLRRLESIAKNLTITYLECEIIIRANSDCTIPMQFSSTIRELNVFLRVERLTLSDSSIVWPAVRSFIDSTCQVEQLQVVQLTVNNDYFVPPMPIEVITPLLKHHHTLHTLTIKHCRWNGPMPDEHIHVLRQLTQLIHLDIRNDEWTLSELDLLLANPMPFIHLQDIGLNGTTLRQEHIASLVNLPTLSVLNPNDFSLLDTSFLSHLPNLRRLEIYLDTDAVDPNQPDIGILTQTLTMCTQIQQLFLGLPTITDEQLQIMLTPLVNLTELHLHTVPALFDLSFLSLPHMSHLLVFELHDCRFLSLRSLYWIRRLSSIHTLILVDSFDERPDPFTLETMSPGERAFERQYWPKLQTFTWNSEIETE